MKKEENDIAEFLTDLMFNYCKIIRTNMGSLKGIIMHHSTWNKILSENYFTNCKVNPTPKFKGIDVYRSDDVLENSFIIF
jgi:hypothetical protein